MKTEVIEKMRAFMPYLNEFQCRLYVASESKALGRGGKRLIEKELGISHNTINAGIAELESSKMTPPGTFPSRQRKEGGGRKKTINPAVLEQIEAFVKPHTRGEPESALQWVSKSLRNIESALNVGITKDTAEFAVQSIRNWWYKMGIYYHNNADSLLITADGGGSNSSRGKLWKYELQKFANETGLTIEVVHFPPGTSKWNKIEHRLFSYISKNWRAKPLVTYQIIVSLIAATRTTTGLKVACEIDEKEYQTGIEISDEQFAALNISPNKFHGE